MLREIRLNPIQYLQAFYSETRNEACRRQDIPASVNLHVTKTGRIVPATEYVGAVNEKTKKAKTEPYYKSDGKNNGDLIPTAGMIGDYKATKYGLIGSIPLENLNQILAKANESADEKKETIFDVLREYNKVGESVSARVEKLLEKFGDFIFEPGTSDPVSLRRQRSAGLGAVPIPQSWKEAFVRINKPS